MHILIYLRYLQHFNIMQDKSTFIRLYNDLESIDTINKEFLLRVFLEFLIEIDFTRIDFKRFTFSTSDNGYNLNLFSNNDENCPLFLEILNHNQVDVQLHKGGEYIYLQPISDWSDVRKLKSALGDIFYQPIEEELIICNGKLASAVYTVNHKFEESFRSNNYSIYFGSCWFWQKKRIDKIKFKSWL